MTGKKLTARGVATAKVGRHGDGDGLWLVVGPSGARKWIYRFTWRGKVTEMGLGSADVISLAKARSTRDDARKTLASGCNPIEARKTIRDIPTFGQLADDLIQVKKVEWRHPVHLKQWKRTVEVLCASLRNKRVDSITTEDVLTALRPVWTATPVTASRMRQRIEAVLNAAKAKGYRVGENPAAWRGHLSHLLPNHQRLSRKHYPSMDYHNVGAFIERLREEDYMSAKALEFTILTAVRSKETFGARWSEIDKASKVWVIPKERMKAAREHRVPLSARAIQILESLKNDEAGDYIFSSPEGDKPLSPMSMQKVLIRMGVEGASIHGFRSSFRNWVGNETAFPREVAEAALAHAVGGVEGAYWTSDALEKRRKMMDAWAGYIEPKRAGNILKFSKAVEGGAA